MLYNNEQALPQQAKMYYLGELFQTPPRSTLKHQKREKMKRSRIQNMAEGETVSLKLLIDTKSKKVIFAEAKKDFVDFLFHMLSLPLGTVVKLITKERMVGCLGDLYKSIEALNNDCLQPNVTKDTVLTPMISCTSAVKVALLSLPEAFCARKKVYRCSSKKTKNADCVPYYTDDNAALCPCCSSAMVCEMSYVYPPSISPAAAPSKKRKKTAGPQEKEMKTAVPSSEGFTERGYVKGVVTYMVMDNLVVKPMSTISSIILIKKFNVKNVADLVEKEVHITLAEGVALLKASLKTKAVLSSVFLQD